MKTLNYRSLRQYKYQLMAEYKQVLPCALPELHVTTPFFSVEDRLLTVDKGYSWDGPSGPTWDTETFMRGSLVHDVLYQMMREKLMPFEFRDAADRLLQDICLADGMNPVRATYVYWSLWAFGAQNARPK